MKRLICLLVLLCCSVAAAQDTPLPPPPLPPSQEAMIEQVRSLRSYRKQLEDINICTQQMITGKIEDIKIEYINTAQIRVLAYRTPEQQMLIAASDEKIRNLTWICNYHIGLMERRNMIIFELQEQIDALLRILGV